MLFHNSEAVSWCILFYEWPTRMPHYSLHCCPSVCSMCTQRIKSLVCEVTVGRMCFFQQRPRLQCSDTKSTITDRGGLPVLTWAFVEISVVKLADIGDLQSRKVKLSRSNGRNFAVHVCVCYFRCQKKIEIGFWSSRRCKLWYSWSFLTL